MPPETTGSAGQDRITDSTAQHAASTANRERTPFDQIRRALGSRVVVTLDYDDPKAVLKGTLRSISEDGEVCVVGEDGMGVYGWPCLIVTVIPDV